MAEKLVEKDTKKVTERDIQEYWILLNTENERAKEKITGEERELFYEGEIDQKEYDALIRERITEGELNELSDREMDTLAIYREMQKGSNLVPQMFKEENVTEEEFAKVSEQLDSLPGVDATIDWNRKYVYEDVFRSALGSIRSIPEEQIDEYLSKGYSRDDRVGTSFLELQYEDSLKGKKSKVKTITDKAGTIIGSEIIEEGERGKDLVLSIDIELQAAVEKIVEDYLKEWKSQSGHELLDRAFVVMQEPTTGEVLAMVGKQYFDGEIIDYNTGAYMSAHEAGSSVKGATVFAGYQDGIISPGDVLKDEPIRIAGSPTKSSWFNTGGNYGQPYITDAFALEKSSNSYMFKIAIEMAGATYRHGEPINIPTSAFTKMRDYLGQFGLGVETEIDMPEESIGYQTHEEDQLMPGKLLDLSIGQFDKYTTMQMAQYVSAIANGGDRLAPTIVKEIREPSENNDKLGPLLEEKKPVVLNKLDNTEAEIAQVQKGFYGTFNNPDGTGKQFQKFDAAGKTGTAEAVYYGPQYTEKYYGNPPETTNSTLVGYAPYEQPEVAFSVLVPWVYKNEANRVDANQILGTAALEKYLELKESKKEEE